MAHIVVRPGILSDAESFAALKFKTWNETYEPFGVRGDGLMTEEEVPPFITGWPARIVSLSRTYTCSSLEFICLKKPRIHFLLPLIYECPEIYSLSVSSHLFPGCL